MLPKMIVDTQHTAILLFTRTAEKEASLKRLQQLQVNNVTLHRSLQGLALNTAKSTGLPVVCITEDQQRGYSFGERIANAFRELFYQGYYNVIGIGADCPDLNSEDLEHAHDALQHGNAVIGPDKRGGAYLIALNRDMFKSEIFERLLWQTKNLCSDLELYFGSIDAKCELLISKSDLNFSEDIQIYATSSRVKALLNALNTKSAQVPKSKIIPQPFVGIHSHRGPPQ